MIYTFYSYKGGVGRTMALANIAELFYRAGYKVLMVDWDLESPGLEKYFPTYDTYRLLEQPGIMDLLRLYMRRLIELPDLEPWKEILPSRMLSNYLCEVYPEALVEGNLRFLSAGRRTREHMNDYARQVRAFNLRDFFERWEGERFFEWLRQQFNQVADIVLIDSRTGFTEMGGVCTYQLADAIVMFCAPNRQNLDGTLMIAQNLLDPRVQHLRQRPLDILIVPTRIEMAETAFLNRFHQDFIKSFALFTHDYKGITINDLWDTAIPYVPRYAYEEAVAVREYGTASSEDITRSYTKIFQLMMRLMPAIHQRATDDQ